MGRIADSHDELYHYTTTAGLSGILQSKSLWAAHPSFVNDDEEIPGFYDRALPKILRPAFHKYIEDIKNQAGFRKQQGNTPPRTPVSTTTPSQNDGSRRWRDCAIC